MHQQLLLQDLSSSNNPLFSFLRLRQSYCFLAVLSPFGCLFCLQSVKVLGKEEDVRCGVFDGITSCCRSGAGTLGWQQCPCTAWQSVLSLVLEPVPGILSATGSGEMAQKFHFMSFLHPQP